MPWDLSEFDRNRLEKGRKLLQESEEHRGCRDLRVRLPLFGSSRLPLLNLPRLAACSCMWRAWICRLSCTASLWMTAVSNGRI